MNSLTNKIPRPLLLVGICVAILATAIFILESRPASGNVTSNVPSTLTPTLTTYTYFATSTNQETSGIYATSTSATSTNITSWTDSKGQIDNGYANIAGAQKVTFLFTRGDQYGGGNTGNTVFRVQVTPDGTNWFYWDKWQENATSTINQTSKSYTTDLFTLVGTSTIVASMDLGVDSFLGARVVLVETTDGWHQAKALVQR